MLHEYVAKCTALSRVILAPEVGRFILMIIFIPSSFYTVKHFLLLYKNYEGSRKELKEVGERNMPGRTDR
jgi:hypothetical protein